MPIPENKPIEYERVKVDEWITGEIEEVEYEKEHAFTFQGQTNMKEAVRFRFRLDGYQFPHRSRWMTFIYSDRSNLFNKYVKPLVEDAVPWMNMPTEAFHGLRIKTMWDETSDAATGRVYQHLEKIKPLENKILFDPAWKPGPIAQHLAPKPNPDTAANTKNNTENEEVPF